MNEAHWIPACPEDRVTPGHPHLLRERGHQIALFRVADGNLYAVHNACPHEGYPLLQGVVKDCTLTCAWHNFKFDLRDGSCRHLGEPVRSYPMRVRGGVIEVDVAPPDPAEQIPHHVAGIDEGLHEGEMGRVARDVVRLLRLGVPAPELVGLAVRWDAEHARFGATHAMPVAADVLPLLERYTGSRAALPIMQVMELASEEGRRLPRRAPVRPEDPGPDPIAAGERLAALVEEERFGESQALLAGALERGWHREVVEPWLLRLCTDHFIGFGHGLIYQVKVFDLLEGIGWRDATPILVANLFSLSVNVRHDTLPTWSAYRDAISAHEKDFPRWLANRGAPLDRERFLADLLSGGKRRALEATAEALAEGVTVRALVDALSIAAGERMLRFELALELDPTVQEGWLDVSHVQTFTRAVRVALSRYHDPRGLRWLFQAARFVAQGKPLDGQTAAHPPNAKATPSLAEVLESVAARRSDEAVDRARAYLATEAPMGALQIGLEDVALDDAGSRPIVAAHYIKNTRAGFEELAALGDDPLAAVPLLGAIRLLAAPLRERRIARLTHEAIRFVEEGRRPNALTS